MNASASMAGMVSVFNVPRAFSVVATRAIWISFGASMMLRKSHVPNNAYCYSTRTPIPSTSSRTSRKRPGLSRNLAEPSGPSVDNMTKMGTRSDYELLQLGNLVVLFTIDVGAEKGVEHLVGHLCGGEAQTHGEDVGVVPSACAARGLGVGAQRGPHPSHLVGGDRHPRTGPAAHDASIDGSRGDCLPHGAADVRPRLAGGDHDDLVASFAECSFDAVSQGRRLVRAESDAHRHQLRVYWRSHGEPCVVHTRGGPPAGSSAMIDALVASISGTCMHTV